MGLMVSFISGPRKSGKSAVIEALIKEECRQPPHYIRVSIRGGDKRIPKVRASAPEPCGIASARWLRYERDEIFNVLPEALESIHKIDRNGTVLIEGDSDPDLRHAYPYDFRLFVMPVPGNLLEVFRTSEEAAGALREVLHDTTMFAKEMYGLMEGSVYGVEHHEPRPELTISQWRGLLSSPLGNELATRIQFQPNYHGIVESDVVLINAGLGARTPFADQCIQRIDLLLRRIRDPHWRSDQLIVCDPLDPRDENYRSLFKALAPMCRRKGRTSR